MGSVIVGAGLGAAHVAATLRDEGYDEPIAIVGDEGRPPYERPGLSKDYLQGKADAASLSAKPEDWYAQHDVETRFGDPAVEIDRDKHLVRLASGEALPYTFAVLATGARSRRLDLPGADLAGVHYLRTLDDSTRLRDELVAGAKVAIVGGGWIGLEVAAAAKLAGCDVTVLERADVPLAFALGDTIGSYFADLHRRHGVVIHTGAAVEAIEGTDGRVTGVRTNVETVPADLVLVAAGAIPNTQLAEQAGLGVNRGILADDRLRCSDPRVLAVGDVAVARNRRLGPLRVEHWDNAIRQGRLAALSILGRPDTYDWYPYFFTDQFDLGMEYVGRSAADDDVVVRGDLDSGAFISFWLRSGHVTAAMNVNVWDVNDQLRAVVGHNVSTDRLADPDVPLTDLTT